MSCYQSIDDKEDPPQSSNVTTKLFLAGTVVALVLGVSSLHGSNSSPSSSLEAATSSTNNFMHTEKKEVTTTTPNIFLFTVDDLGWNDIGYNSNDLSGATPYMKEIAKKGIKLTQYYTQPSCTPSRVTMMTGKFAYKNGFQNYELNVPDYVGVPLSNKLMPEHMKDLGYKTIGFGKWNIGHCNEKYLPSARGFEHFIGYVAPGHGYVDHEREDYYDMIEDWSFTVDGVFTHKWKTGAEYKGTYDTLLYRDKSTAALRNHFRDSESSPTPMFMWLAHHGIHAEFDSDPIPPSSLLNDDNQEYLKGLRKRLDDIGSEEDGYAQFFKMRMITASVLMSMDNVLKHFVETVESVSWPT
jgi:arylsulfatase B